MGWLGSGLGLGGGLADGVSALRVLRNLAFLDPAPIVAVAWTLSLEMCFYGVCCCSILLARGIVARFAICCGALALCALAQRIAGVDPWGKYGPIEGMFGLFLAGGAIRVFLRPGRRAGGVAAALCAAVAAALAWSLQAAPPAPHGGLETSAFAIATFLAFLCAEPLFRAASVRRRLGWAARLGDQSYSIYLIHLDVIFWTGWGLSALDGIVSPLALGCAGIPLALAQILLISHLSFHWLERPSNRFLVTRGLRLPGPGGAPG